ncbi:MAG: hypothetical protein JW939_06160 [Candidatus Thermoplasmatota archaeon]|nr:hypothetical protein [Candidatus Thermoplasmatota archaeon]
MKKYKWGDGFTQPEDCWINNSVTYGTNNNFMKERWHIFHYCIIIDKGEKSDGGSAGVSERPKSGEGDDFIFAKSSSTGRDAHLFMDEMCHNFRLWDLNDQNPITGEKGHRYPNGVLITPNDKTTMYYSDDNWEYCGLTDTEWTYLDFTYINHGDSVND